MNKKTYFVNQRLIFNLESMNDKLWCLIDDIENGERALPVEIAGVICSSVEEHCNHKR